MVFKEAFRFAIPLAVVAAGVAFVSWVMSLIVVLMIGFVFFFFRNPKRISTAGEEAILSPADGKVTVVSLTEDNPFTSEPMLRIGIFMSVFDVHVNRSPYEGEILGTNHQPGQFLDAREPDVDIKNENLCWHLRTVKGEVVVKQIAGLIARRIVPWKKEGDRVRRGEEIGLIRFGSRVDLYFPQSCSLEINLGQKVVAGQTILAKWPH